MAKGFTSYTVDNDKSFNKAIRRLLGKTDDLTIPLTLISKDFYKSEKAIFELKGRGKFPDLAPDGPGVSNYKRQKFREVGFIYPILVKSGRLRDSLTDPTHKDAINEIVNKNTLFIGSRVEYLVFHHHGD